MMNAPLQDQPERSPYVQLMLLTAYALAGLLICSILGVLILYVLYGEAVLIDTGALVSGDPRYLTGLKLFQMLSTVGLFLAPPLFLAWTERRKIKEFYSLKKPVGHLLFVLLLIMVASMPFMEWTALWNQKMGLPSYLKSVEQWMRLKETEAMRMTIILLKTENLWGFLINLFMIALLPAVGEELMFRGGVQRSFKRMFGNPHVAIWLSALIFSAIHMQFYGFLPRLLLGAGFGYIYLWTGNLWYAILAHFINNAYATCVAWYLQMNNMPLNMAEETFSFPWYGYVLSFVLTIFLLNYFKNKASYGKQLD